MKTLIRLFLITLSFSVISAQQRISWTDATSIKEQGHLAHLVVTMDGTTYAMCYTQTVNLARDEYHLYSKPFGQQSYSLIWERSGTIYHGGAVQRPEVHLNDVYFSATDGIMRCRSGELDRSLNVCRDSSYTVRMDVEQDGSVFLTGPTRLLVPEYDSIKKQTRYGTTNISTYTDSGCTHLLVARNEYELGAPRTVGKHEDGTVLVSYFVRSEGNDVLLRTLDQTAIPVALVENQEAYDIELIHPTQDGWIFCLVQIHASAEYGIVIVRTDKLLQPIDRYVPQTGGGCYRFCAVQGNRLVLLVETDVSIIDTATLDLMVAYNVNDVVPEEHRPYGATLSSAAILDSKVLIGTNMGYATMSMPTMSSVEGEVNSHEIRVVSSSDAIDIESTTNCDWLRVTDVNGRTQDIQYEKTHTGFRLQSSQLVSGLNFIRTCEGVQTLICVVH